MNYKTILFDLDGTITDPALGITSSVAYALDAYGHSYESLDALKFFIGPPLRELFMEYCGIDEEKGEEYVRKYREYYSVKGIYQNSVYEGIEDMLKELKAAGKTIVLATSKPEKFAKIILDYFKLTEYFDFVAGANMDNTRTTKSDVINYALESLTNHPDKNTAVMVGDRLHDIIGGRTSGIHTVGVTFGYGSRQELESNGAEKIVDSVKELTELLLY